MRKSYLQYTRTTLPHTRICRAELKSSQNGFRGPKNTRALPSNQSTESPGPPELARFEADSVPSAATQKNRAAKPTKGVLGSPQHKAAMRLVPIFLITAALADDEKRDWFRIRRTPGVRRAKGERMRGVSMTKGLNPPSKHGWPVDHPTMPRRDDHPGRPLKSRAAHIRRKRGETREKHREKTRRAKAHRDDGALR